MKRNVDISVSTMSINDYQNIIEYAKQMQGVAEFLHCDITNENFVDKNNYDYALVKNINRNSLIMLDVHLMVDEPAGDIAKYIDAGADIINVHYEAFQDKEELVRTLKFIQQNHTLAGMAINPNTTFAEIRQFVFNCDVVLVMGVVPGACGQTLIQSTIDKVKELDKFRTENNLLFKIEFDGGVTPENAKILVDAGADMLVSGSYVYNSKNKKDAVLSLKG
ncbi:MAG: ribulose-phosphate 3-epimerase [Clostridia bacterium]|nr:ribulose-phosphate 3-epimerase [Clostridia bacterium]